MSEHEHKREVKIFIDQQAYHSPNPTTGAALYAVGDVKPGMELFAEVTGDREDPELDKGPEPVRLKEDEHFHSGPPKVYHIIVNGRKRSLDQDADLQPGRRPGLQPGAERTERAVSVTYRKGPKKNHEGTMTESETVRSKDGMIFDGTETNKS